MPNRPHRVFISYSHRDAVWKDRVLSHFRVLAPNGEIDVWDDSRIGAGDSWETEIAEAIESANTAILLISADFLTSEFIRKEEVSKILALSKSRGLRVIPLIVKPCAWMAIDWLRELQARPKDGQPLSDERDSKVDSALADLALEVYGAPPGPGPQPLFRLKTLALAALPAVLVVGAAIAANSIRVRTPLQLDIVTRTASFIVAGDSASRPGADARDGSEKPSGVQLLSSAAALSRFTIEQCDVVSFPPLQIGDPFPETGEPVSVTLRCDPRVPGSKVQFRAVVDAVGTMPEPLGTLGRIIGKPGDRVALTLVDPATPAVRIEVSGSERPSPVDFTLGRGVPFEIRSEFADVEGSPFPIDAQGIGVARALLPPSSSVRLVTLQARHAVNFVLQPTNEEAARQLFEQVDVPVEGLSLFERDDIRNQYVSTALEGTLSYPTQGDSRTMSIARGVAITLSDPGAFRLTRLSLDQAKAGLGFRIEGEVGEVRVGGEDRRLTLLEEALPTTTARLVAFGVVAALQWLWLKHGLLKFNPVFRLRA